MNIEEDIKMLKKLDVGDDTEFKQAIENILADRERLEKENNTLAVENFRLNTKLQTNRKEYQETYKDVREEIKELQTKANKYDALKNKMEDTIEEINADKLNYSEDNWYLESEVKDYAIDNIKELLEEEEV